MAVKLEEELRVIDGDNHQEFAEFNQVGFLSHVLLAYSNGELCASGALREYSPEAMELKRMYTLEQKRNMGIASLLLGEF